MSKAISVVVPVLREAENLALLVPAIAQALEPIGKSWSVIIVDDDSRDGTVELCESLKATYPLQLVLRRSERGLSSAVLDGFRRGNSEILVVLDADLSHPPQKIPELLEPLESDEVDFALGSRFVEGGSTPAGWGVLRELNSRIANMLARPLVRVNDPMSGFFALRRSTFESSAELDPLGFKIGLELMVKCRCRSVREIPIDFRRRAHGTSKLSPRVQWSYVRHLVRLYRFKLLDKRRARRKADASGVG